MKIAVAVILLMSLGTAEARTHHVRQHYGGGVSVYNSAAGPITLAPSVAPRMLGFIAALVQAGYRGPVHCYAPTGHIRNSLHHWGGACDFSQRARNKTVPIMYHVGSIAARFGLRDGCSFHDCGHIDAGRK